MKEYDRIYIRDLLARCIIGIYENERKDKQDVIINVTLFADFKKACESDDINEAIDYKIIKKKSIICNNKIYWGIIIYIILLRSSSKYLENFSALEYFSSIHAIDFNLCRLNNIF